MSPQARRWLAGIYRTLAAGPLPGQSQLDVLPHPRLPNTYTVPFLGGHLAYAVFEGKARSPGWEASCSWSSERRDQAEHAAQSLAKGSRVVVVGRLQQRSWTAEDGRPRSVVEVVAEEPGPSLRWATATPTRATRGQNQ